MTHLHYRVWDGEQMYYSGDEGLCLSIGEMMPNKVFGWSLWLEGYGVIAHSGDEKHILMWGTVLKDKNGRLMYEKDVVKGRNFNTTRPRRFIGEVEYSYNGYTVKGVKQYTGMRDELNTTFEVIGDVFRNPELLEAAE